LAADLLPTRRANSRSRVDANRPGFDAATVVVGRFDPRAGEVRAFWGEALMDVCSDIGRSFSRQRTAPSDGSRRDGMRRGEAALGEGDGTG